MQSNKTCMLLEEYLGYLSVIKGRSDCTIKEYRTDVLMFFTWLMSMRGNPLAEKDFTFADMDFIKSITLNDMYAFLTYYKIERNACAGSRARKIVSIRQFWKYLKRVRMIQNNVADELETPKIPKRISKFLLLEESVRLLIAAKSSPRDHCILTIFLNCALRISELASLNVAQVSNDVLTVVGKGSKERKIFLTPATKRSLAEWLEIRNKLNVSTDALFISKNHRRITIRALQDVVKKYVALAGLEP